MIAPKVFDQRDDGIVILLDETPPAEEHAAVRESATVCPGAAIRLEESA
jgi:ferredoxin